LTNIMTDMERKRPKDYLTFLRIVVAAIFLILIAYEVYLGVHLKKIGIAGLFEVEFAPAPSLRQPSSQEKIRSPVPISPAKIPNKGASEFANNLPESINRKTLTVENEKVEYPERKRDMGRVENYLKNGDFKMAEFKLDQVIQKQRNLRTFPSKLPNEISEKLSAAAIEIVDYPNRKRDMDRVEDYLKNGNFRMAEFKLDQIIQKQRNLRGKPN
jgi:hypothetical protein